MDDLVGRTFGRWLVQGPLSHGGRGALYEATATDPDLRAAIRFIEAPDQAEVERSKAEYDLLRAAHFQRLRVFDFGIAEVGGSRLTYLVMDLLDGESLVERLERGALTIPEAATIAGNVAAALEVIHRFGIGHLDIKPANIVTRGGPTSWLDATLIGFGTAQRVGSCDPVSWKRPSAHLAPEQERAVGAEDLPRVSSASDIYALGVTLFEMLTRAPLGTPAMSKSPAAQRLELQRPDVPREIAALVAAMLAHEPAERPAAPEVARVLERYANRARDAQVKQQPYLDPGAVASPGPRGRTTGGIPVVEVEASPRPAGWLFRWFLRVFPGGPKSFAAPIAKGAEPTAPQGGSGPMPYGGPPPQQGGSGPMPYGGPPPQQGGSGPVPYGGPPPWDANPRPMGGGVPVSTPESTPGGEAGDAGVLFWNIAFPDNDAVIASRVLVTGTPYALETALQTARAARSFAQATVDAAGLLGESTEVPVKFVIDARGARVRAPGARDWGTALASAGMTCRATGTDVFRAEVQADAAGPVAITVAFHVRGAITLRETIALYAVAVPGVTAAAAAPAPREPDRVEVSAAAIQAVPAATLVLRLEPFERWYGLQITAGGVEDAAVLHTLATTVELAKEAVLARKKLVALSRCYRAEPASDEDPLAGLQPADRGDALLEIARIGRRLHAQLFGEPEDNVPLDLARIADLIRQHGHGAAAAPRMQIDAETLPFPWGIVYDAVGPLERVADIAVHGFWGRRFAIDRTISAILRSLPPPTLEAVIQPCLNPHLDREESLGVVARQRKFFERIGSTSVVRSAIESSEQLRAYLENEGVAAPAILYFFCHARAAHEMNEQLFQIAAAADEQASLMLDPSGSQAELSVAELKRLRRSPLKARPLVFLNACSSAEADQYYQSQFLTLFVSQWQARAFIGSDWKVPTVFADAFARRMLDRFLGCGPGAKLPLGAALHATAAEVLALGNPFPLIYALYGRPELLAT